MTAKGLILPAALSGPRIGKYTKGIPRTRRPAYAAWLFGTDYVSDSTVDITGNGRTLIHGNVAAPIVPFANYTEWPHVSYYKLPFHFDAPAAAGPANEFTLIIFGKVTGSSIVYWWRTPGVTAPTRQTTLQVAATYDAIITVADGLNSYSSTIGTAGAWRPTDFAMWSLSLSHWNKQTAIAHGGVWDFAQGAVPFDENPSRQLGGSPAGTTNLMSRGDSGGAANLVGCAGAFVFDYAMTPEELKDFYDKMRAFYSAHGLTV